MTSCHVFHTGWPFFQLRQRAPDDSNLRKILLTSSAAPPLGCVDVMINISTRFFFSSFFPDKLLSYLPPRRRNVSVVFRDQPKHLYPSQCVTFWYPGLDHDHQHSSTASTLMYRMKLSQVPFFCYCSRLPLSTTGVWCTPQGKNPK